jgi:diguanylate cyclase (GGDEF)-like protein
MTTTSERVDLCTLWVTEPPLPLRADQAAPIVRAMATQADGSAAPQLRVISSATADEPGAASANQPRLDRLAAELDLLEMVPFVDADAAFAPALALERRARALGAEDLQWRAQLIQADVLGRKGKHTASGQLIREINDWAEEHGHKHVLARSHRLLAMFFDSMGDMPSAWTHAVRAVELVDDSMSERLRADHLFGLGVALVRTGAYDAARDRYRAALQLAEGLDDVRLRLKLLNNLAWLEEEAGDAHRSMEIARRMMAFAAKHHMALDAACLDTIAHAQLLLGEYEDAEATLRPILDDPDLGSRDSEGVAEALRTAASAQRLQGRAGSAQATLDRCVRFCEERGIGLIRVEALQEQAQLYAEQGMFERAYQQYIEYHEAEGALRAAEREANARTLQAVFETTEARREGERFRELALRDALTGLRNRRFVENDLSARLARAVEEGESFSVALVDLDHFKLVNDRHSHAVGDQVLCRVADVLAAATAESGWTARMGGEEFLLAFPGVAMKDAAARCEEVRQAVESFPWAGLGPGLAVTVSIGVTGLHPGRTSQASLLGQADRNLYAAKYSGRNRVASDLA